MTTENRAFPWTREADWAAEAAREAFIRAASLEAVTNPQPWDQLDRTARTPWVDAARAVLASHERDQAAREKSMPLIWVELRQGDTWVGALRMAVRPEPGEFLRVKDRAVDSETRYRVRQVEPEWVGTSPPTMEIGNITVPLEAVYRVEVDPA